jgi:hypothetical protein
VVEDIAEKHEAGQPVLVGTISVEKSEYLSRLLHQRGIAHEVLNAKQHDREATIVAQAGRKGAVTVATNMAGRGTDIMLGGNPEHIAADELRSRGLSPVETPDEYEEAWPDALERATASVSAEHDEVVEVGGLYVLGTERHESRRIDNQLRGRSGRQGDPGLSRFYLSLGDDLMRLFNASAVEMIMDRLNIPDDVPIESKMVSRAIRSAQTQVESQNFEIRKNVLKYDEVLNRQRTVIYDERRKVLNGVDLHEQIAHMVDDVIEGYVFGATAEGYPDDWDLEQLWTALRTLYPISIPVERYDADRDGLSAEQLIEDIREDARQAYVVREESLGIAPSGEPVMRELERRVLLSVMDRHWREHLYEMDYLQEGIGLRAMGQRDPLVEYQREGFDMFNAMMEAIKEEAVGFLYNVEVQTQAAVVAPPPPPADLIATGPGESSGELVVEHLVPEQASAEPELPLPSGRPPPRLRRTCRRRPRRSSRSRRAGDRRRAGAGARLRRHADAPDGALPTAPVGVAGSPVPSGAPMAGEPERSLDVEHPALPTPVAGPEAGSPADEPAPQRCPRLPPTSPIRSAACCPTTSAGPSARRSCSTRPRRSTLLPGPRASPGRPAPAARASRPVGRRAATTTAPAARARSTSAATGTRGSPDRRPASSEAGQLRAAPAAVDAFEAQGQRGGPAAAGHGRADLGDALRAGLHVQAPHRTGGRPAARGPRPGVQLRLQRVEQLGARRPPQLGHRPDARHHLEQPLHQRLRRRPDRRQRTQRRPDGARLEVLVLVPVPRTSSAAGTSRSGGRRCSGPTGAPAGRTTTTAGTSRASSSS